jgi:hypothetical protein
MTSVEARTAGKSPLSLGVALELTRFAEREIATKRLGPLAGRSVDIKRYLAFPRVSRERRAARAFADRSQTNSHVPTVGLAYCWRPPIFRSLRARQRLEFEAANLQPSALRQKLPAAGLWPGRPQRRRTAHVDREAEISNTGTSGDEASGGPHQFRTRNGVNETQRKQPDTNKREGKSTNLVDILPLITVWLQVRFQNRRSSY